MLKTILTFILDTLAPPDPCVRYIEGLNTATFRKETLETSDVKRLSEIPDVIPLLPYRNPLVKTALIELKTNPNRKIGNLLGQLLFDALVEKQIPRGAIVVPIPITPKKKRERGWNQCELVLDGFRQTDREKIFECRKDILIKSRENADQVGMSRNERFENLKDCFTVRYPNLVQGKTIVVFDDIVTTGATMGDARRALLTAQATQVICIAVAH